jgi:hypothetical protein
MWWRIGFSGFDSVIGLAGPFARHGEGACHENKAQADDFVPARKFTTSKFRLNATRRNGALIDAGQSIGVEIALPLPDLPDRRRNVRCREKSGKHMLPLIISAFDPSRTFVGFPVNLCAHPVDPPMGLIGGITSWLLS